MRLLFSFGLSICLRTQFFHICMGVLGLSELFRLVGDSCKLLLHLHPIHCTFSLPIDSQSGHVHVEGSHPVSSAISNPCSLSPYPFFSLTFSMTPSTPPPTQTSLSGPPCYDHLREAMRRRPAEGGEVPFPGIPGIGDSPTSLPPATTKTTAAPRRRKRALLPVTRCPDPPAWIDNFPHLFRILES
jgi:hypothetical protein